MAVYPLFIKASISIAVVYKYKKFMQNFKEGGDVLAITLVCARVCENGQNGKQPTYNMYAVGNMYIHEQESTYPQNLIRYLYIVARMRLTH